MNEEKVLFVWFQKELVALFPELIHNDNYIVSYSHIGQHSGACPSLLKEKRAKKEEYKDLLNELKNIGYIMEVINNE